MTQTVTLHFATEPLLMRVVRKQTAAAASVLGASRMHAGQLELAVGEALANARDHGYGGAPGPVELDIAYEDNSITVSIHDEGKGLSFAPDFPTAPDPRRGGGWGLQLIKELMDDAELQCPGPKGVGTTVRMSIRLCSEAEANPRVGDHPRREPWWQ